MELGKLLCEAMYRDGEDLSIVTKYGISSEHFDGYSKELFDFIWSYKKEYGSLPNIETINFEIKLPEPFAKENKEPLEYYVKKISRRNEVSTIADGIKKSIKELEKVKTNNEQVDSVMDALQNSISKVRSSRAAVDGKIINLKDQIYDRVLRYSTMKNLKEKIRLYRSPWPHLDDLTNGIDRGNYWVIAARPGTGKTFSSLLFLESFRKQASENSSLGPPMLISMEMSVEDVMVRSDSIRFELPNRDLRRGELDFRLEAHYLDCLTAKDGSDYYIVGDDAVKCVDDVERMISDYNPGVVVIDSMWLLENEFLEENKRVTKTSRDLKKVVRRTGVPIVATAQLNRENDVALSDAIKQDVNVLIKQSQTNEMRQNDQMFFQVDKSRDGRSGNFVTYWDHKNVIYRFLYECDNEGNAIERFRYSAA